MRKQKTLKLNPDITVTVLELRPVDLKHAIGLMQSSGGDIDFQKMLTENWDDVLAKLSGVIRADKGNLEEVSFSEINEIQAAFVEVNAAFFERLKALGINIMPAPPGPGLNETSIERAADSLIGDIQTAGTTAGDFS